MLSYGSKQLAGCFASKAERGGTGNIKMNIKVASSFDSLKWATQSQQSGYLISYQLCNRKVTDFVHLLLK